MKNISLHFLKALPGERYVIGGENAHEPTYIFSIEKTSLAGRPVRSLMHEDNYYFAVAEDPARDSLDSAIKMFDVIREKMRSNLASSHSIPEEIKAVGQIDLDVAAYEIAFSDGLKQPVTVTRSGNVRKAVSPIGMCEATLEGGWWNFSSGAEPDLLKVLVRFHEARFYSVEEVVANSEAAKMGKPPVS